MKNLHTLVKLHKSEVEKTLKEIMRLNGLKELMEKRKSEIKEAMQREIESFFSTEFGFALESYQKEMRSAIQKLNHNIESTDKKLDDAQILLHAQFGELKKFEIVLQKRQQEAKDLLDVAEMKEIDEMNILRSLS